MHELVLLVLIPSAALAFAFFAGLSWRDRRRERETDVVEVAIVALDSRVRKLERVTLCTDDVE